jgi:DNA-directed RNA polymerase I, II, and III subunit RPABC2
MEDDDNVISGGLDFEEGGSVFEEEMEGWEAEEAAEMGAAFKKLYATHPECNLDYVESVIANVPLKVAPPKRVSALEAAERVLAEGAGDSTADDDALQGLDKHHTTYPFLTQYERARVIGFRANQLSQGAEPFIVVPDHVSDVREIARLELAVKRLPFIIKRPLPDGKYEYWRLQDLLQI